MSIIRVCHNRENPYVQLNKQALWNPELSLKAIGLWARCMSRPDDWRFNVKEIVKNSKEGRRAIDSAIHELISQNYALKLGHYEKESDGKFSGGGVEYVFFEFPASQEEKEAEIEKFKKCFRHCGFGDCRDGDCRNDELLKKEEELKTKEETKIYVPPPPEGVTNAPLAINKIPKEATELAKEMFESIKKMNPDAKEPNLSKWAKELERTNRLDKRSWKDIREMIKWAHDHNFWYKNILSPEKLRMQWDKLSLEKNPPMNSGTRIARNRSESFEAKSSLKNTPKHDIFLILIDRIQNSQTNEFVLFDKEPRDFNAEMCRIMKIRKG